MSTASCFAAHKILSRFAGSKAFNVLALAHSCLAKACAGKPCPDCNSSDASHPPPLPAGFTVTLDPTPGRPSEAHNQHRGHAKLNVDFHRPVAGSERASLHISCAKWQARVNHDEVIAKY
jgi:hypothetical protein